MQLRKLSIVTPAYNEAENLPLLFGRVKKCMSELGIEYELIAVDDGSSDQTIQVIEQGSKADPSVKGVILSRNFGHQAALNAGIDAAGGDAVVVLDADMQQPPELIKQMVEKFKAGADIVIGIRKENAQNNAIREFVGQTFYKIFNKISDLNLEPNAADFGLYSRGVVEVLRQLPEKDRFLRGLINWVGFKKDTVEYEAVKRMHGVSKYNFKKLMRLAMSGITSFSAAPLRFSFWVGLFVSLLGFVYAAYAVVSTLFLGKVFPPGWLSLIVVISILGGIQLMVLGIIGEYISKIYYEVKSRPLYIVKRQVGFENIQTNINSRYGVGTNV